MGKAGPQFWGGRKKIGFWIGFSMIFGSIFDRFLERFWIGFGEVFGYNFNTFLYYSAYRFGLILDRFLD